VAAAEVEMCARVGKGLLAARLRTLSSLPRSHLCAAAAARARVLRARARGRAGHAPPSPPTPPTHTHILPIAAGRPRPRKKPSERAQRRCALVSKWLLRSC
jgi:hypothetical protein